MSFTIAAQTVRRVRQKAQLKANLGEGMMVASRWQSQVHTVNALKQQRPHMRLPQHVIAAGASSSQPGKSHLGEEGAGALPFARRPFFAMAERQENFEPGMSHFSE